jgi:hypothetical protein
MTMKKMMVTVSAALIGAFAIAASAAPANAGGNFNFTVGIGGYGPGWGPGWYGPGYGYGGGIYVNPYPYATSNWTAHVQWCFANKGPSYNPKTNKYVNGYGKMHTCHSPYA